jgi:hypothetical protein
MQTKQERQRTEAMAREIIRNYVKRRHLVDRVLVVSSRSGGVIAGDIPSALAAMARRGGGGSSSGTSRAMLTPLEEWVIDVDSALKVVDRAVATACDDNQLRTWSRFRNQEITRDSMIVDRVATYVLAARLVARPKTAQGSFSTIADGLRQYTKTGRGGVWMDLLSDEVRVIYDVALREFVGQIVDRGLTSNYRVDSAGHSASQGSEAGATHDKATLIRIGAQLHKLAHTVRKRIVRRRALRGDRWRFRPRAASEQRLADGVETASDT